MATSPEKVTFARQQRSEHWQHFDLVTVEKKKFSKCKERGQDDKVFWWYVQHENALAETHEKAFAEFVLGRPTYTNSNDCNIAVYWSPDQLIGLIESLGKELIVKLNRLIVSPLLKTNLTALQGLEYSPDYVKRK